MIRSLLLVALGTALAADTQPPSWPDGAWLEVAEDEALFPLPARTEAELAERERVVQLHLRWPAARDHVGVAAYHLYRCTSEAAVVGAEQRSWEAMLLEGCEDWSVVPVDDAGNRGSPLQGKLVRLPDARQGPVMVKLIGTRGGAEGSVEDVFADGLDEQAIAELDAAFAEIGGIAVAKDPELDEGSELRDFVSEPPSPMVTVRVGLEGEQEAAFERTLSYCGDRGMVWMFEIDGQDLVLRLLANNGGASPEWSLELATLPHDDEERLSLMTLPDPLGEHSLGACARERDFRRTGGLWVSWGVDPRGGDPYEPCRKLDARVH